MLSLASNLKGSQVFKLQDEHNASYFQNVVDCGLRQPDRKVTILFRDFYYAPSWLVEQEGSVALKSAQYGGNIICSTDILWHYGHFAQKDSCGPPTRLYSQ